jgi:hypothetical protein
MPASHEYFRKNENLESQAKGTIEEKDIQRLLPFQTRLAYGVNHIHIVNASAYPLTTTSSDVDVEEGDALCYGTHGYRYDASPALRLATIVTVPTCPTCIVNAKHVIVAHLSNRRTPRQWLRDWFEA